MPELVYTVRIVMRVDRPDLRDASYYPVAAGSRALFEKKTTSFREAVGLYHEALSGEWDSGSEYVTGTQVEALDVRTERRTWTRRPRHRFERGQSFMDGA